MGSGAFDLVWPIAIVNHASVYIYPSSFVREAHPKVVLEKLFCGTASDPGGRRLARSGPGCCGLR